MLAARPDLIMASACLTGRRARSEPIQASAARARRSPASTTEGWPDREAHGPANTITDSLSPRFVALAIASAMLERSRTGRGRAIDLSQIEAAVYVQSEAIARCAALAEVAVRAGNRDEQMAPHGVYPCAGDDCWIAVAVDSDAAWRRLREAMGRPTWMDDPTLDTAAGRLQRAAALDIALADWTRSQDAHALARQLQEARASSARCQLARPGGGSAARAARPWVPVAHPKLGRLLLETQRLSALRQPGRASAVPAESRRARRRDPARDPRPRRRRDRASSPPAGVLT